MVAFYILVIIFLCIFMSLLMIPLLVGKTVVKRDAITNTKLVKARLEEMRREVTEGILSDQDFIAAEKEVKIALIEEQRKVPIVTHKLTLVLLVGLGVGLLVTCLVYFKANHISGVKAIAAAPDNITRLSNKLRNPQLAKSVSAVEIQSLALAIRLKLKEDSEDPQGWMFLGRLRMSIGQIDEAIAAFERSLLLNPENNTTRTSYAQALMMSNTDQRLQQSQRQLRFLLSQNEENDNLTLMMAVVSAQLGQNEVALPFYKKVRERLDVNNPVRKSLDEQFGFDQPLSIESSDNLSLTINIDASLNDKLPSNGHVVVFVRPNNETSGVPIAAKRFPLNEFPINLNLDDNDAMLPTAVLSKYDGVNVTVRISKTQNVESQLGDLEGRLVIPNRLSDKNYSILIDKEVN